VKAKLPGRCPARERRLKHPLPCLASGERGLRGDTRIYRALSPFLPETAWALPLLGGSILFASIREYRITPFDLKVEQVRIKPFAGLPCWIWPSPAKFLNPEIQTPRFSA